MDTNQNSLVQYQEMNILEDELDSIVAKKGVLQDKKATLEQQVQIYIRQFLRNKAKSMWNQKHWR